MLTERLSRSTSIPGGNSLRHRRWTGCRPQQRSHRSAAGTCVEPIGKGLWQGRRTGQEQNQLDAVPEQRGVSYEVFEFSPDIHPRSVWREALDFPVHEVYKTLVVMPPASKKPVLVVVQGDLELNLKRVGTALGQKGYRMATQREAEGLTGAAGGRNLRAGADEQAVACLSGRHTPRA